MTLTEWLDRKRTAVHFEPLVSIRRNTVIGHEARLTESSHGEDLHPGQLVSNALAIEVDRWYRQEALTRWKSMNAGGLLFLNFDTAVLDMGVAGSGRLAEMVRSAGIDPAGIVIGIRASQVKDMGALKDFVLRHRHQGFLIGLKGTGEGHSNLERMVLARPDILIVSDAFLNGLDHDFVAQEIMKSLSALSRKIGTLLAVEGVTTETQALAALDHGVDLLQGPYFGVDGADPAAALSALAVRHKAVGLERSKSVAQKTRETDRWMSDFVRALTGADPERFDDILSDLVARHPRVECVFVVNDGGLQESRTHTQPGVPFKQSALFHPARPGADHSMKEYVYLLADGFMNRFRTEPYVSLASGRLCRTLSGSFRDAANNTHILCLDLPWDDAQ